MGLSPDLLTLTSRTSIQNEEINSKTEEKKILKNTTKEKLMNLYH